MDLVGVSLLIIALAFVALVVYLILLLKKLTQTVDEAQSTLKVLTTDLDSTLYHTNELLAKANVLVEDVNGKVNTIDPVFSTLADLSVSVADLNQQARKFSNKASTSTASIGKVGTAVSVGKVATKLFRGKKS